MDGNNDQARLQQAFDTWASSHGEEFAVETKPRFASEEGIELARVYTPLDLARRGFDYLNQLGLPGDYPFTRGITASSYRSGLWRISQYSGYSTPEECNELWKAQVASGLNTPYIAYDLPTQLGYDPDHPMAAGEVGRTGVSLISLRDWEIAFEGIDIEEAVVSQVFNAPAAIGIALHLALARKRGIDWKQLRGIVQNDVIKEYIARGNYIFPPEPSVRLVVDSLAFCASEVPNYLPITVCTVHYSEQGANRVHEIAFALAAAITYIQAAKDQGVDPDLICPHLMWLANAEHYGFFHEIAKLRALRNLWARTARERFQVQDPQSAACRLYSAQGGTTLAKEQHLNNIARNAISTLAAALAGVQVIDLRCYDEQWGIPSKEAQLANVRIQQIVGHETGITETVDPLGGSYYLECLTLDLEQRIAEEVERIESMGGMVKAIEDGYPQRTSFQDAYEYQKRLESADLPMVGFNCFREAEDKRPLRVYRANRDVESRRVDAVQQLRRSRDAGAVETALLRLKSAATKPADASGNLMPCIIEAVEAYATVGEICGALREVWGEFPEPAVL